VQCEKISSSKYSYGKTPWQTFRDATHLAHEKQLDSIQGRKGESSSIDNLLSVNKKEV